METSQLFLCSFSSYMKYFAHRNISLKYNVFRKCCFKTKKQIKKIECYIIGMTYYLLKLYLLQVFDFTKTHLFVTG